MAGIPYLAGSATAASGGSTSLVVSISTSIPSGDSINVGILIGAVGPAITSVTDTQFNTYTQVINDTTQATAQLSVWQCENAGGLTSGTDTITVVYSTNASVQGAIVVGDNNTYAADKAVNADNSTGTTASVATGALAQAEENVIAFLVTPQAGGVPTWTNPTGGLLANISAASTTRLSAEYGTVASATGFTASATIVSGAWAIGVVTEAVNFPSIVTVLAAAFQNVAYSQTLASTGGVGPYTYAVTSGSLPAGLSLTSGVVSGTPTTTGTSNFTITVTDSNSVAVATPMSIRVFPAPLMTPAIPLPNNILTIADSDFESGAGTWAADVNASGVTTSSVALTGSHSLTWTTAASGSTQVHSGLYPCKPNMPYIASGYILTPSVSNECFIGIEWYTAGSVLISTIQGDDCPATTIAGWQPVRGRFTAPSNATQMRIFAQIAESNKGDTEYLDLVYAAQTNAEVLIDFINPPFTAASAGAVQAGASFQDVSMFVKLDVGISITRGRQDSISEVQAGTCNFSLQNDTGVFTRKATNSLITVLGGNVTLGRRCQVNLADQNGAWYTRFDGPLSQIDYIFDNTGNTSVCQIVVNDILAFLQRGTPMRCWTAQTVLNDNPQFTWPMTDAAGSGNAYPVLQEVSGNGGPVMRPWNSDTSLTATVAFQSASGGIETLSNAVSAASANDGSEFWNPGSDQPTGPLRGLDSGGVGPYTTPAPGIYLTPKVVANATVNTFTSNAGWEYVVQFPNQVVDTTLVNNTWTIECWFTMDPSIKTAAQASSKVGPYTILSLGSSRQNDTVVVGIYMNNTTTLNFEIATYSQPPAFILNNFSVNPTILASTSSTINLDNALVPHHLVVIVQGAATGGQISAYLDCVLVGSGPITTRKGATYDTLTVGGAYGGYGCHFGTIQQVSIYNYALSQTQMVNHCANGQYGMWESTTDDCIAALGQYAGIPSYWNSLTAHHLGCSLTDYFDITGSSALSAMQVYEQTEAGLLYVNAVGQLSFYTRDWKMGYGAPDLLLGPDTFDSSMGYQVIDQFLVNEAAISTRTVSAAVSPVFVNTNFQSNNSPFISQGNAIIVQGNWTNQTSQNEYGIYAPSSPSSPQQLPLIAWSRGYANLGVGALTYWPDPNLQDLAQWQANHNSEPFMSPGLLNIDMLSLNKAADGIGISDLYALEIGNMIAPTGKVPGSFPNVTGSMEWFIEGINETISQTSRTWQAFTSPAALQRAWKPGDPVYGMVGTTSLIGVSAPDVSVVQADGKDVAHDGGPPYWPPTFTTTQAINLNPLFSGGSLGGWFGFQATLAADNRVLYPGGPFPWSAVVTSTGGLAGSIEGNGQQTVSYQQGFESGAGGWGAFSATTATSTTQAETGTHSLAITANVGGVQVNAVVNQSSFTFPVAPGQQITMSSWLFATAAGRSGQQGITITDALGNNLSGVFGITGGAGFSLTNGAWVHLTDTFTMPANAAFITAFWELITNPANGEITYLDDVVLQFINNSYSVGAWINSNVAQTVNVGVDWGSPSGAYLSTSTGPSVALTPGIWTFVTAPNLVAPTTGAFATVRANAAAGGVIAVQNLRLVQGPLAPNDMNNPAQNTHGFVGARDIRGMHDSLARLLKPPMVCVGAVNNNQSVASGGAAATIVAWDSIFIDTEGGMGAVAGWPNWYVVTVPGFYDIDASIAWNSATAGGFATAWIVVAVNAAQAVAAGTSTPILIGQYVCPIGEMQGFNTINTNNVNALSTRMYLGAGDMIGIATEQTSGATHSTASNFGGSRMSLVWRGYGRVDDRVQVNSSLASGGTVTNTVHKVAGQYIMKCSTTYSYQGNPSGSFPPTILLTGGNRINTNGFCYQGFEKQVSNDGSTISTIVFPFAAMRTAISAVSGVATSITVQATNVLSDSSTGVYMDLGWSSTNPGGSNYTFGHTTDHPALMRQHFKKGQTINFTVPTNLMNGIMTGGAKMLTVGSNKFYDGDTSIRGAWNGGPGWWVMTVNYLH